MQEDSYGYTITSFGERFVLRGRVGPYPRCIIMDSREELEAWAAQVEAHGG